MSTKAEIQYWMPATKKVIWHSDGDPRTVIFEEILPMIQTYKRDVQEYLLSIMDSVLIPRDDWFNWDYRYYVEPIDYNENVFVVVVNGYKLAKINTLNKVITIFREALKQLDYEEEDFPPEDVPDGFTLEFS